MGMSVSYHNRKQLASEDEAGATYVSSLEEVGLLIVGFFFLAYILTFSLYSSCAIPTSSRSMFLLPSQPAVSLEPKSSP